MPADTVYLAVATICGGAAIKLVDYFFGAPKQRSDISLAERKASQDEDRNDRAELRAEAKRYRELLTQCEVDAVQTEQRHRALVKQTEDESDAWRKRFYELSELTVTEKHAAMKQLPAATMPGPASLLQSQAHETDLAHLREQVAQLLQTNEALRVLIRAQHKDHA